MRGPNKQMIKWWEDYTPTRDMKAADKTREDINRRMDGVHLVNWGVTREDGSHLRSINRSCNANLASHRTLPTSDRLPDQDYINHTPVYYHCHAPVKGVVHSRKGVIADHERRYHQWMANESAWSLAFVTKDADDHLLNGGIYTTDYDPRYVVQAAYLMRYYGNYPVIIQTWDAVVQQGVEPHWALGLAHALTLVHNGERLVPQNSGRGNVGFQIFELTPEMIKKQVEFAASHDWSLIRPTPYNGAKLWSKHFPNNLVPMWASTCWHYLSSMWGDIDSGRDEETALQYTIYKEVGKAGGLVNTLGLGMTAKTLKIEDVGVLAANMGA